MPELPEVETIRRDLIRAITGKKIKEVIVTKDGMVRGSVITFRRKLKEATIEGIDRKGKLLIFIFKKQAFFMLIHLKMTGQLIYQDKKRVIGGGHSDSSMDPRDGYLPNKHTHVVFKFSDRSQLFFNDMRQFGYLQLVDEMELERIKGNYGMEPLTEEFTFEALEGVLKKRKTALKNALLDQKKIAGLGNIYVDEASFYAGVRPMRRADRLTHEETKKLYRQINRVIKQAIEKRGTTFGSYRDGKGGKGDFVKLLKVYGRAGEGCSKCKKGVIKKTKVNGRGTAYCPVCQPK